MQKDVKKKMTAFQTEVVEPEFREAISKGIVEEIYWVGGEPLMYEQHWRYMKRIIELGDGPGLYARYNTNLSRIKYKGICLHKDILPNIRDWQICASLDGTGAIGEYIRTGLKYDEFVENFGKILPLAKNKRQMRLDYTLTLPGMFDIINMQKLANKLDVEILAKVVFTFSPDIMMSPLALPRKILNEMVDKRIAQMPLGPALTDVLTQLKNRPNIEEQWPEEHERGLRKGKRRILTLESIRPNSICFRDIISTCPDTLAWWDGIDAGQEKIMFKYKNNCGHQTNFISDSKLDNIVNYMKLLDPNPTPEGDCYGVDVNHTEAYGWFVENILNRLRKYTGRKDLNLIFGMYADMQQSFRIHTDVKEIPKNEHNPNGKQFASFLIPISVNYKKELKMK